MTCVGVPFYFKYKTATILPTSPMHVFALQCRPKIQIVSICSWPQQCELMQKVKTSWHFGEVHVQSVCLYFIKSISPLITRLISDDLLDFWARFNRMLHLSAHRHPILVLIDTFLHVSWYAADYKLSDALCWIPLDCPKTKANLLNIRTVYCPVIVNWKLCIGRTPN